MSEREKEYVRRWTETLARDIASTREPGMRTVKLAQRLARLQPETIVRVIDEIFERVEEKAPLFRELMSSLVDIEAMTGILGYQMMSDIYLASKEAGYERVTRLLSNPPPKKKPYSEYDFVEGQVQDITLGEKRSFAKGINKDRLDRLLYDPDPLVVRNLLNNPRLTERDVLKIASKRPTTSDVLMEIFNNKKWLERYSVKNALVRNPFTPTRVAVGLVNFLFTQELQEISKDGTLHPEVRSAAEVILKKDGAAG